ncbi:MAG: hypothetical protein J6S00_02210, partial [Clostridia bacterium]|nr:hypothetical protein [Clostridia bacterium]
MLKRVLTLLLCASLIFVTSACKSKKDDNDANSSVDSSSNNSSVSDVSSTTSEVEKPKLAGTNKYTDPSIYTIDTLVAMGIEKQRPSDANIQSKAEALEKKILNSPDTLKPAEGGKYIYVANGGVDKKGYGFAPDTPVETIEYANLLAKEGDVVVLKR